MVCKKKKTLAIKFHESLNEGKYFTHTLCRLIMFQSSNLKMFTPNKYFYFISFHKNKLNFIGWCRQFSLNKRFIDIQKVYILKFLKLASPPFKI